MLLKSKRSRKVAAKKPRDNPYVFRRDEVVPIWIPKSLKPKVEKMVARAKLERVKELLKEKENENAG